MSENVNEIFCFYEENVKIFCMEVTYLMTWSVFSYESFYLVTWMVILPETLLAYFHCKLYDGYASKNKTTPIIVTRFQTVIGGSVNYGRVGRKGMRGKQEN